MNICIISSTFLPEFNGVSTCLWSRLLNFSEMGHKILILCPDYSVESEVFPEYSRFQGKIGENISVRPVPTRRELRKADKPKFKHWTQWNFKDYIGSFSPDLITVEDPDRIFGLNMFGIGDQEAYGKCIGVEYARENSIPIIAFYHTNYPSFADQAIPSHVPTPFRLDGPSVYKKIYGHYDSILCSCKGAYDYLKAHGLKNVNYGEFVGINDEIYGTIRERQPSETDRNLKIFYAGRFDTGKDVSIILKIFDEVNRLRPDIILYLAGNGNNVEVVHEACRRNKCVKYLGYVKEEDLSRIYDEVDIYLSPHKTDTFGLSILEAMSRYIPVVAANEGGPIDIVKDGYNGFLCGSQDEFIEAILKLAGDRTLRMEFGSNGRKFAERYFSKKCAQNLLNLYETMINRGMKYEEVQLCSTNISK